MTTIQPATDALLNLAAEMRPDWNIDELRGALAGAHASSWSWPKAFNRVAQLLTDEQATPRDLLAAVRDPLAKQPAAEPTAEFHERLAEMRNRPRQPAAAGTTTEGNL